MPVPAMTTTVTLDTLNASTVELLRPQWVDNMTHNIRLFHEIYQAGNIERRPGGVEIIEPIATDLNQNVTFLATGSSTFNTDHQEPATKARFQWKLIVAPITLYLQELLSNQSPAGVASVYGGQVGVAELTLKERLGNSTVGLFGNVGDALTGLCGLQSLVSTNPTANTVGGIAGSTVNADAETFWANGVGTAITDWSTDGIDNIRAASFARVRGNDVVSLHVATALAVRRYIGTLTGTFTTNLPMAVPMTVKDGMENRAPTVLFDGAPVIFDYYAPADQWRGLNLNYLKLVFQEGAEFIPIPFERPHNALYVVGGIACRCELVTNARNRHFVLTGADSVA